MNLSFYDKETGPMTQEMVTFYYKRTREHIDRVRKWIDVIYKTNPKKYAFLLKRKELHDLSKYEEPLIIPYIYLTWRYHCKETGEEFKVSAEMERKIQKATYNHVKQEAHHPEFHDVNTSTQSINKDDKDKPSEKIVDGTRMSDVDLAEMVADWLSMSDEKGTDPVEWANSNIGKRWSFNKNQIKLIYELIGLYKKNK